jgi:hypothetical protein
MAKPPLRFIKKLPGKESWNNLSPVQTFNPDQWSSGFSLIISLRREDFNFK